MEVDLSRFGGPRLSIEVRRRGDFAALYQVALMGNYDPILEATRPGDIVVDAGANIGAFTLLAAARVGSAGLVVAVEPEPGNFEALRRDVEANGLRNVALVRKALLDEAGRIVRMEGEGTVSRVSDTGSPVETTTLDELAREYGSPRILKMDIEGSEGRALRGAREALRGLELAMLEVHDQANYAAVGEALSDFDLRLHPAEDLRAVIRRAFGAPLYVLRLEAANRFATTRRVIRSALRGSGDPFPALLLASRRARSEASRGRPARGPLFEKACNTASQGKNNLSLGARVSAGPLEQKCKLSILFVLGSGLLMTDLMDEERFPASAVNELGDRVMRVR